jgi:hypothetical protein
LSTFTARIAQLARQPGARKHRLYLAISIGCVQAPQALGDSPFVGNYDRQAKVGASRSSDGAYAGDSKSFYIDSANTPEVVLFDEAVPRATRVCAENTIYDDIEPSALQVSYRFSDGNAGTFNVNAGACADIFAARVGVKPECTAHVCKLHRFVCVNGAHHDGILHVTVDSPINASADSYFGKYLQSQSISRGGNTFVVSEKPFEVEIWGSPGFVISYQPSYSSAGLLSTKEMTLDWTFVSGALIKMEYPPFPSHPTFAYMVIYK